ncbi:MAG: cell division topological specificity factor MinE [Nitrococcus sp.]|nr:cell division topological specificity factor MinE [Nitrococcus sp.]
MNFLSYFRAQRKQSASVAKERLQIIVARERLQCAGGPDYLPMLQDELLAVVRKYIAVDRNAVRMQLDQDGDCEVLELNITLPDNPQTVAGMR